VTRPLSLTALLAAGAIAAGCGGDDEPAQTVVVTQNPPQQTQPQQPAQTAPAAQPVTPQNAQQVAQAALIQQQDLPGGFQGRASGDDQPSECDAIQEARANAAARETGQQFEQGQTGVEQTVYVYTDEAQAQQAFAGIDDTETTGCLRRTLNERVTQAASGRDLETQTQSQPLEVEPAGTESAGAEFLVTVESGGQSAQIAINAVYVRQGPVLSLLLITNRGGPVDASLRSQAAQAAARRAQEALQSAG